MRDVYTSVTNDHLDHLGFGLRVLVFVQAVFAMLTFGFLPAIIWPAFNGTTDYSNLFVGLAYAASISFVGLGTAQVCSSIYLARSTGPIPVGGTGDFFWGGVFKGVFGLSMLGLLIGGSLSWQWSIWLKLPVEVGFALAVIFDAWATRAMVEGMTKALPGPPGAADSAGCLAHATGCPVKTTLIIVVACLAAMLIAVLLDTTFAEALLLFLFGTFAFLLFFSIPLHFWRLFSLMRHLRSITAEDIRPSS